MPNTVQNLCINVVPEANALPAALLEPAGDVVPHVVGLEGVEQEVGSFDQLRSLLVLPELTGGGSFREAGINNRPSLHSKHQAET